MKHPAGETSSSSSSPGEGGDRAAVEQARKRIKDNAEEPAMEEGKHCEWLWDASLSARSVATFVADKGREVRRDDLVHSGPEQP